MTTRQVQKDHRYPRPRWLRTVRRLLLYWWLLVFAFASNAVFNLFGFIEHRGSIGNLTAVDILQALYIDQITMLAQYPLFILPLVLAGVLLIVGVRWARADSKTEALELLSRQFGRARAEALMGVFVERANRGLLGWLFSSRARSSQNRNAPPGPPPSAPSPTGVP